MKSILQQKIQRQNELLSQRKTLNEPASNDSKSGSLIKRLENFINRELDNYVKLIKRNDKVKTPYLETLNRFLIFLTPYGFKKVKVEPFLG